VPIFVDIQRCLTNAKQARLERLLGAPLDPLKTKVVEALAAEGKRLGGKGEEAAKKTQVLRVIRQVVTAVTDERRPETAVSGSREGTKGEAAVFGVGVEQEGKEPAQNSGPELLHTPVECQGEERQEEQEAAAKDIFDQLAEFYAAEKNQVPEDDAEGSGEHDLVGDGDEDQEEEPGVEDGSAASPSLPDPLIMDVDISSFKAQRKRGPKKRRGGAGGGQFSWKKELGEWFHGLGGLEKISAARPSTAAFGNLGVLKALRHYNDTRFDVDVSGSLFMGVGRVSKAKGEREYVGLSRSDSPKQIESQWAALREAFLAKDSVLLFHLKNHYALIFAMREWEEPLPQAHDKDAERAENGEQAQQEPSSKVASSDQQGAMEDSKGFRAVRQILTSRRGQRPSAWVDFEEARQTMLGWSGYKIMHIHRRA